MIGMPTSEMIRLISSGQRIVTGLAIATCPETMQFLHVLPLGYVLKTHLDQIGCNVENVDCMRKVT
jgi:hypothetical protein